MPVISIKEQEALSLATFDVTENTVLIPILYPRTIEVTRDSSGVDYAEYTETAAPASVLCQSATDFKSKMSGHEITVDGEVDKSYVMAYELLLQGLNVVLKFIEYDNLINNEDGSFKENHTELNTDEVYEILQDAIVNKDALKEFESRNIFNIKFITSGGYSNCITYSEQESDKNITIYTKLRDLANARGDALALIEFKNYFSSEQELFEAINSTGEGGINNEKTTPSGDYVSAAFFPWIIVNSTANRSFPTVEMPACFGYLMAYASSIRNNANWFAASGVSRGSIPNLVKPVTEVNESLMHILQCDTTYEYNGSQVGLSHVVNPIYNAGTYGYRIWGNRVFAQRDTIYNDRYVNFLNVRILMCDIKKQIYHSSMRVTFEPNDDIVWINFKTLANSLLDRMKSGRGLVWYKWKKEKVTQKALIKATLTIQPIEAVESFDFTVILTENDEASVQEVETA